MEQLEVVKENVMPLRRGRTVAAATAAAEGGERENARQLESERSAFEAELAAYDGDDPLAVWLRFVTWTQQHYPAGGPESQLLATLEKCTRTLLPLEGYKTDVRYLRVWVQYADCCNEPKDIFDFMELQGIGQDYALFYEARAAFLELRGAFPQALNVYMSGINRQAQPLQRLKTKFASFESRMARREERKRQDEADGIFTEEVAPGARETLASRPLPAAAQRVGGLAVANCNSNEVQQLQKRRLPKDGEFSIFQDEGRAGGPSFPSSGPGAAWNTLATQADLRKENTQAPAVWNTVRLSQARGQVSAPSPGFVLDVYEDNDTSPPPATRPAPSQVALRKLDAKGSDLLTHPVLNHVVAATMPRDAERAVAVSALLNPMQPHDMMRIADALEAAHLNGEVSFEEARALRWLKDAKRATPAAPVVAPAPTLLPVDEVAIAAQPASPVAVVPQLPEPVIVAAREPVAVEEVAVPDQAATAEVPQAEQAVQQPSVDVCAEKPRFPLPVADDTNMTINMRDAYADIMTMFSDALPGQNSRKRACKASTFGRASVGAAFAEPLFEVYEGEASPSGSPAAGSVGPSADADVLAVFEDGPGDADFAEYASDAENENPLDLHHPILHSTGAPDDSQVFRPWSSDELRAAGGEDAELDAEMHTAAEAILHAAAGPAELLAQDSFEVYEGTGSLPEDASQALQCDTASKSMPLQLGAAPPNAFDSFEVYEDTTVVPHVAFAEHATGFIDPFSPAVMAQMLSSMDEPLCVMPGVTDEDESAAAKLESSLSAARRHPNSGVVLQLGGFKYVLGRLCGRGAYADIYEATDEDDVDDLGNSSSAPAMALKVVRPPDSAAASWEFVVLRRVAERVPAIERQLFVQARRLHMAGPLSVLVTAFGPHGTLQDAVNALLGSDRGGMHESLAMYLTVELLRALEVLHAAAFIHGDVKPDNVLLRFGGSQIEEWTPNLPGTWRERGIALIDFGRSIDLAAHAPGAAFMGDCGTENFRCVEMLAGKPWTFQADTFGALGCVHVMLFGTYMEVDFDEGAGRWRRREPLKRYWQTELWEPFFDGLLNVPSCQQQPELHRFRAAFEQHLAAPPHAAEVRTKLMELTIIMAEAAKKAAR